jgi:3-oxoacyl-[acyl-carrier-protein] synthase-3
MDVVRIAGVGSHIPEHAVSNDAIASFVEPRAPGKNGAWALEKLGILSRRTVAPLDALATLPSDGEHEIELACAAGRAALAHAGLDGEAVDGFWYVSGTQTDALRRLSRGAFILHRRLGLRPEAFAFDMDAGCGGATYAMHAARHLILGDAGDTLLVVAANVASPNLRNAEAYLRSGTWLPLYIFGDGAGAIVLRRSTAGAGGILASYAAVDPSTPLMEFRAPAPGCEPLFLMDARAVALSFRKYARAALTGLQRKHPFDLSDVRRFYFHQVNGTVLRDFVAEMGIAEERVAFHVDRYGNLAAAATLVLLDEDVRSGTVGPGDLCLFCTVGAGAQYGAMLVRL